MVDKNLSTRQPAPPPPAPHPPAESAARRRSRQRHLGGDVNTGWSLVVVAAVLVIAVVASSIAAVLWFTVNNTEQEVIPTAVLELPTPVNARLDFNSDDYVLRTGSPLTLSDGREIIISPWDGESRFTILVMGIDRRPGETGLAYRTDTMMVVSLDPETNSIGILSIPRDLYVPIANYNDLQRVNSALVLGELRRSGSGPQLAMQTVQNNLGIRINEYLIVDFNGFIKFVDAIGGIEVTTTYAINDPAYPSMYYGYDPFYLPAGTHLLDGATALKFARSRHGSSDFQRAKRQQDVLYAVRDRIMEPGLLPQLIVQAPSLFNDYQENVATGLTIDQIIQLTLYLRDIPSENIKTGVIDQRYVSGYETSSGAQVLIPNRARLGSLMTEVFGQNYNR